MNLKYSFLFYMWKGGMEGEGWGKRVRNEMQMTDIYSDKPANRN
jgi:hypothetical protein